MYSDCKSAIAEAMLMQGPKYGRSGFGDLHTIKSVYRAYGVSADRLHHVKAHAERAKLPENYTKLERGNMLADKVAGHVVTDCAHVLTISTADILKYISCERMWRVVDVLGVVRPVKPLKLVKRWRADKYLKDRDADRETAGLPPKWVDADFSLVNKLYKHYGRLHVTRARICKLVFDKYWHGGNRIKGCRGDADLTRVLEECVICGDVDNEYHSLVGCLDSEMVGIRDAAISELAGIIRQYTWIDGRRSAVVEVLRGMALHDYDRHTIWKGVWSSSQKLKFRERLRAAGLAEDVLSDRQVRSALVTAMRVLADACMEVRKCHAARRSSVVGADANDDEGGRIAAVASRRGARRVRHARRVRRALPSRPPTQAGNGRQRSLKEFFSSGPPMAAPSRALRVPSTARSSVSLTAGVVSSPPALTRLQPSPPPVDKSYRDLLVQARGEFVRVTADMPWGRCVVDSGGSYDDGDGFRFEPSDQHYRASNELWALMRRVVDVIDVVGVEPGSEAGHAEEWGAALAEFGVVSGGSAQLGSVGFSRLVRVGVG